MRCLTSKSHHDQKCNVADDLSAQAMKNPLLNPSLKVVETIVVCILHCYLVQNKSNSFTAIGARAVIYLSHPLSAKSINSEIWEEVFMMNTTSMIKFCKPLDLKEEHIVDLYTGIAETFLTGRNLTEIKSKISKNPNLISTKFYSSLFYIVIEPNFPFPEFVHWIEKNYVKSKRQVLSSYGSRVICQVNSDSVKRLLGLPLPRIG